MSKKRTERDDPRELRYAFPNPLPVTLSLRAAGTRTLSAKLLDVAQGGAKIALEEEVEPQRVRLQLGVQAAVEGEIRWCWQSDTGPWIAGCSFAPQLPGATFAAIVEGGRIDRLRIRASDSIALSARGEISGPNERIALQNHSTRGFCLWSRSAMVTGERLRLQAAGDQPLDFSARVQWQLELEDGFLVGCQFSSGRDVRLLNDALDASGETAQP